MSGSYEVDVRYFKRYGTSTRNQPGKYRKYSRIIHKRLDPQTGIYRDDRRNRLMENNENEAKGLKNSIQEAVSIKKAATFPQFLHIILIKI